MSATPQVNERMAAILEAGTAPWLDQLRRDLIADQTLATMVAEDCLRGITSNPAIFEKAILGADLYDDFLEQGFERGASARVIYRAIAIGDVQAACDVLKPVHEASEGRDGFVSLEVDPDLAHDTGKTVEQAQEYWSQVDRPNLMIKIPGTQAGIPAITEVVAAGINVNVTLLFSVESYTTIAEAYIKGLELARERDEDAAFAHSVASFFVSRVDTEVDKRLKELGAPDELYGLAGLANARAAYQRFKEIFYGERFAELKAAGAPVQRPLWASTGVKDERYSDTVYVEGLLGPDTVITMPPATLEAARDHAEVSGATADTDPAPDLKKLKDAGIDMTDVTKFLLDDGIDKFVTPMEKLLAGIDEKRPA